MDNKLILMCQKCCCISECINLLCVTVSFYYLNLVSNVLINRQSAKYYTLSKYPTLNINIPLNSW